MRTCDYCFLSILCSSAHIWFTLFSGFDGTCHWLFCCWHIMPGYSAKDIALEASCHLCDLYTFRRILLFISSQHRVIHISRSNIYMSLRNRYNANCSYWCCLPQQYQSSYHTCMQYADSLAKCICTCCIVLSASKQSRHQLHRLAMQTNTLTCEQT